MSLVLNHITWSCAKHSLSGNTFGGCIRCLLEQREADRAAIRALTADHVNRPHHLNACPMCIEHALAIQRATQAPGEGTK